MPSPDGCFVRVWEGLSFSGAFDFINGPRDYPSLRDMPGGHLWRNRIRSAKVGPSAVVTAWSDENFQGATMRLIANADYPKLPETMEAQIESIAIECAAKRTR